MKRSVKSDKKPKKNNTPLPNGQLMNITDQVVGDVKASKTTGLKIGR
jgi:hypothetical protein